VRSDIKMDVVRDPDSGQPTRATPRIWEGIPPRNKNFTGRDDVLYQLRSRVASQPTAVLPSAESLPKALQGLGGVGKTAVAIEYAWRYQADYDLVCWIRADQMPLVRSSLAGLASALGLAPSASGIDLTAAGVLDALRRGEPYERWLLVFDNANDPDELLSFIPIGRGHGHVLITSRDNRWESMVDTVQMDVFERRESVQFLLKRAPRRLADTDANRLAEALGDLPLALVQAGAVLFEGGMGVDEYLQQLREHVSVILRQGSAPGYPTSMTAAWQISMAELRGKSPQALELLRCCAFLGPEPIPREVFKLGPEKSQTDVGALIADPIKLSTATSWLGRFALVRLDGPFFTVHRLIQALLRDDLNPEDQRRYRQDAHAMLAAGAPGNPADVTTWKRYADLVAHVGSSATDFANCQMPAHRAFALRVVRYLFVSGDFASCRLFAERFAEQWAKDSGPDDPYVLDARRHLGNALRESGEATEAYRIIQETLSSAERVLDLTNPLTLHLRNSFGADLRAHGDFAAALELDEDTRALHAEEFGPDDPQTLRVMNNLAIDYALNSRFTDSRDLYTKVYVQQRDATANPSPTALLASQTGLARAVRLCGNFDQARDLGEDARRYGLQELGPEHHLTLRAATDVSIALRRIPEAYDQALRLATETLELCRMRRGETNPDTLAAAISLSNVQCALGQIDEALALAKFVAEKYPAVYGADHPYNFGCMGNLATLLRLAGYPAEARRLNEVALDGLDTRLTRDHLFSLTVAVNLASDLAALGETSQARFLMEDSFDRLTRLLGDQHPVTLGCAANLMIDLRADGANDRADALMAATMEGLERTLGPYHPMTEAAAAGTRINSDFDPPPI